MKNVKENKPFYKLDHIVKERYPTFVDALRDLDDGLSMLCLYSRFPKSSALPLELVDLSRRLTVEFMHYVIDARALRKIFISIKGYYYQAEIMGQAITWVVPHEFVLQKVGEVDFRVMKTFTEFYVTLMGFINFKLFSSINICYPPKIASSLNKAEAKILLGDEDADVESEYVAALSRPLVRTQLDNVDPEAKTDDFEDSPTDKNDEEVKSCVGLTLMQTLKLQKLFEGLNFFINREVPRESLVFVIRSFGGQVSWDKTVFVGANYDESDPKITHHVVDRDNVKKFLNRSYIQPQWVFDCVNARTLLPAQDYFPGVTLPPHLSPFVQDVEGAYVAPEAKRLRELQSGTEVEAEEVDDDGQESESDEESEDEEEKKNKVQLAKKRAQKEKEENEAKRPKSEVKPGKLVREDASKKAQSLAAEEKRLAVMMIPKKKKRLYDKIMFGKKRQAREVANLSNKRAEYEKDAKKQKKAKKIVQS